MITYAIIFKFAHDLTLNTGPSVCWDVYGQLSPFAATYPVYRKMSKNTVDNGPVFGAQNVGCTHRQLVPK